MIKINNIQFNEIDYNLGGALPELDGGVCNRYSADVNFSAKLFFENLELQFISATKEIKLIGNNSTYDFRNDGLHYGYGLSVGSTINVSLSLFNNGNLTVSEIKEEGSILVVVEALVNETKTGVLIYETNSLNSIDFYNNIVGNSETGRYINYGSDAIQKFSCDVIGAAHTAMNICSPSNHWVTNSITNLSTLEVSGVTVRKNATVLGWQNYDLHFEFLIPPINNLDESRHILNKTTPQDFLSDGARKLIFKIGLRKNYTDASHSQFIDYSDKAGRVGWFKQTNARARNVFEIDRIEYYDQLNAPSDSIDINNNHKIKIYIKSLIASFHSSSKFYLGFLYIPVSENYFQNTSDTMIENLMMDRATVTTTPSNGWFNATSRQVLVNASFTLIDSSNGFIEATIDFGSHYAAKLKTLSLNERNFTFYIFHQSHTITSNTQRTRSTVYTAPNKINWNKSQHIIFAVDNIRCYHFPEIYNNPKNTVGGYEGEPFYVQFPFRLLSIPNGGKYPTIKKIGYKIIAKSGEKEFVIESHFTDQTDCRQMNNMGAPTPTKIQTINYKKQFSYRDVPDELNRFYVYRNESNDILYFNYFGFTAECAFVMRYEYWQDLAQGELENNVAPYDSIEYPTVSWASIRGNYSIYIRFFCEVENNLSHIEEFKFDTPINVLRLGENPSGYPNNFGYTLSAFDLNTGMRVNGLSKYGKTKIVFEAVGDFLTYGGDFYASFFADYEGSGGAVNRRMACSEYDGVASPFSSVNNDENAVKGWRSNTVTVDIYHNKIIATTIYNADVDGWHRGVSNILIYPRLGCFGSCFIRSELGGYVLSEVGQRIPLEACG